MANSFTLQVKPALLGTLCILTWVGCILSIIATIYCIAFVGNAYISFPLIKSMTMVCENHWLMSGICLISSFLCAFGAWLMWRRHKSGFFIYTAGEMLPVVFIFVIGENTFNCISSIFMFLFPLSFIILYASCLRYLK